MKVVLRLAASACAAALLAATPSQTGPLTFSYWAAGQGGMFGMVTQERHVFEAEGLKVQYLPFPTIDGSIRAVQSGASNIGTQNPLAAAQMFEAGTKIVVLAANLRADANIVVLKDSPIRSVRDLRGKRLGTSGPGTSTDALISAILQFGYFFKPSEFEKISAQENQLITFLGKRQIDAALMRSITFDRLEDKSDYRVIGTLDAEWKKYTHANAPAWTAVIFVSRDYLDANRAAVERAMVAMMHANAYGTDNTSGVGDILQRNANLTKAGAQSLAQTWKDSTTVVLDAPTLQSLRREFEAFVRVGVLPKVPDFATFVNPAPYESARRSLGSRQ